MRSCGHLLWRSIVGLGAVLVSAPNGAAAAADNQLALLWQAPSSCPSVAELRRDIERLLGGRARPAQPVSVRAIVGHDQAWFVDLETVAGASSGTRRLESTSCQGLANATALIVALMVDPDAVAAHEAERESAPPVAAPAGAGQAREAPLNPAPSAVSRSTPLPGAAGWRWFVGAHGLASTGTLPSTDVGLGLSGGGRSRQWRLEVRSAYGLRRDQVATAAAPLGAYGRLSFYGALVAGCAHLGRDAGASSWSWGPWGPCAIVEIGAVRAEGFGVDIGFPATTAWVALGAGAFAAPRFGRWSLPIHVDGLVPLRRPRYVFTNVPGTVFQAPVVGVRVSAGVEVHF